MTTTINGNKPYTVNGSSNATSIATFPPPITIATSQPESDASFISLAYYINWTWSIPNTWFPIKASPDNFKSMRLYFIVVVEFKYL